MAEDMLFASKLKNIENCRTNKARENFRNLSEADRDINTVT